MPFPKMLGCLICEDVRPELNRKTTILGLYGLAPVNLLVRDPDSAMERICFFLLVDKSDVTYDLEMSWDVRAVGDQPLVSGKPMQFHFDTGRRHNIGIAVQGVKFPKLGDYELQIHAGDQLVYVAGFSIDKGTDKDFS